MQGKKIYSTSTSNFCPPASYQKATKNVPEMSEQAVAYVDLKFNAPSQQQKKQRPKNTRAKDVDCNQSCPLCQYNEWNSLFPCYNPLEINEEVVTYTELKCHNASEKQRRRRTKNTQGKGSFVPSSVWMLIIVILGIFCLALLIAVGFLSAKVFQVSDPPCGQLENLTKEMEGIQGWKSLCPERWVHRGKKCYHFSTGYKPWLESRKACSSHGSRLLLVEGKEELDFIHPLASFHWIGLSRDNTYRLWMWGNGSALSTDWFPVKKGYMDGDCAVVRGGELFSEDCKDKKRYICEQPALSVKPDISSHH